MGRIRRLLQQEWPVVGHLKLICPLCERKISHSQRDAHHLIPKSKGGRQTEYQHRICHRQIHALFTETELAVKTPCFRCQIADLGKHPERAFKLNVLPTKNKSAWH